MPQGVIFFSLIHLGAQLSLWTLSTGTLLFIAHRNFKIYSADLCVRLSVYVSVHVCKLLSWRVKVSMSLNTVQKLIRKVENVLLTKQVIVCLLDIEFFLGFEIICNDCGTF